MHVYKITNLVNGKFYIGQHSGENLDRYLHEKIYHALNGYKHSPHLFSAIRKHDSENFVIESLVRALDKPQMDALEKFFIRTMGSQTPDIGYNIASGGEGGQGFKTIGMTGKKHKPSTILLMKQRAVGRKPLPMSKESRERLRLSLIGRIMSPEALEKTRQAHLGKPLSVEAKHNMSLAAIERAKKFPNPFLGRHHTPEAIAKMLATRAERKSHA